MVTTLASLVLSPSQRPRAASTLTVPLGSASPTRASAGSRGVQSRALPAAEPGKEDDSLLSGSALRNWLRNHPRLHRVATHFIVRVAGPYEARFERALLRELRGARCFWDVGANVGVYASKASEQEHVPTVVAIEPSAACCEQLRMLPFSPLVIEAALSNEDGFATLSVAAGPSAVSNHLTRTTDSEGVGVRTARGDTLVAQGVPAPDVMKIDVEGFEVEVFDGMPVLLRDVNLRAVCLEVHFAQLHERGMGDAAGRIVKALRVAGFRVRWVDPSHLVARRVAKGAELAGNTKHIEDEFSDL